MRASSDYFRIGLQLSAGLMLAGCWGRNIPYEGGVPEDTSVVEAVECGADLDLAAGINVTGTAGDLQSGLPLVREGDAAALCVSLIDPSPAVTGGEPTVLIASTLCDDGSFVLAGLQTVPAIGAMVSVQDCNDEGTVQRAVTGVGTDKFAGKGPGDTVEGVTAWSLSSAFRDTMQADLGDYPGDIGAEGVLSGFVTDADGNGLSGATVSCASCTDRPTYYLDDTPDDGLWGDGTSFNTQTNAAGAAYFFIPAARITTYTCDDGGGHAWDGALMGSLPDYAVFITFDAL